ncbi:MAG TPA: hypothetical protein VNS19_01010 [Acidimicrobiales bacterium]|jgi:hypothetical protein|nr:hypothetical protein [Acidimicrobiales bacterium]
MAKGRATEQARPAAAPAEPETVGSPLLLVGLGYLSVLASLPLITADGIPAHVVGYVVGALIPILIIGIVRRVDLNRRRSPYYVPWGYLQPALVVLAIAAVVAAGLHVWPIATELAS